MRQADTSYCAFSTAFTRRFCPSAAGIELLWTNSVSTSIIAAVMPFGCAMLCARLSSTRFCAIALRRFSAELR